jgi:serine/threonine protein kinase HipA of HipAB toxin-antitoxin module
MGVAGSSAAGEFPKFAAARSLPGRPTPHVLVKFSAADDSTTVRRWADLLVCEHLALEAIRSIPGVDSAHSRILCHGGRTFLEVERFDRHGQHGRSPLCSLKVLNAALLGDASTEWPRLAAGLHAQGLLDAETMTRVRRIAHFGKLIANTDMHLGNLSFRPGAKLELAPCYDMLPMLYAPLAGGEVPERSFSASPGAALPLPSQRADWLVAHVAAQAFWQRAADDERIGADFRRICALNAENLQSWRALC